MKAKICALAIASVISIPAFAQIELNGSVDAFVGTTKLGDVRTDSVDSSGLAKSWVGISGTEVLGGGLKAHVGLEREFDIDTGATSFTDEDGFNRRSTIGLSGDFGRVDIGRQASVTADLVRLASVLPASRFGLAESSMAQVGVADRIDNSVRFEAPAYKGLQLAGQYAFSESDEGVRTYDVGAHYVRGPLQVMLSRQNAKDRASDTRNKVWMLGGAYDFGVVGAYASYLEGEFSASGHTIDQDAWALGLKAPVSNAGTLMAEIGEGKIKMAALEFDARRATLGYEHALSKRTSLYALYARTLSSDDLDASAVGGGMRHTF